MEFIPWPDGCKLIFGFTGPMGPWANVLAFTKPDFTLSDMNLLNTAIAVNVTPEWEAIMADGVVLDSLTAIDMRSQGGVTYVSQGLNITGDAVSDMVNPSLCVGLTLRTGGRGRAFRGRIYVGGLGEVYLEDGLWTQAAIDDIVDQYEVWQQSTLGQGWTQCVASEQYNGVKRENADMNPVLTITCRSRIPSHQRRRDRRP